MFQIFFYKYQNRDDLLDFMISKRLSQNSEFSQAYLNLGNSIMFSAVISTRMLRVKRDWASAARKKDAER